jgi:hypothetical protein
MCAFTSDFGMDDTQTPAKVGKGGGTRNVDEVIVLQRKRRDPSL